MAVQRTEVSGFSLVIRSRCHGCMVVGLLTFLLTSTFSELRTSTMLIYAIAHQSIVGRLLQVCEVR